MNTNPKKNDSKIGKKIMFFCLLFSYLYYDLVIKDNSNDLNINKFDIIWHLIKNILFYYILFVFLFLFARKIYGFLWKKEKTIMVVLGSGGHTSEMLLLLKRLDIKKFKKVVFVYSNGDITSLNRTIINFQNQNCSNLVFKQITRSRKVGQDKISSIFTTMMTFIESMCLVLYYAPNLVVSNGPGNSVPVCYSAFFLLMDSKILFVESWCRTVNLTISAKLIRPISDRFIVLWESLGSKGEYKKIL